MKPARIQTSHLKLGEKKSITSEYVKLSFYFSFVLFFSCHTPKHIKLKSLLGAGRPTGAC